MRVRQTHEQLERWRTRLGPRAPELDQYIVDRVEDERGRGVVLDNELPGYAELFGRKAPPPRPAGIAGFKQAAKLARSFAITQELPPAVPFAQWPDDVKAIAAQRFAGEIGVGDTCQRLLGIRGTIFKIASRLMRRQCGCDDKQAWLNAKYPYELLTPPAS